MSVILYLLIVSAEGYCNTGSHSGTHTHTHGRTPLYEGSALHSNLCLTTFTRDRHPCPRRNYNLQSQQEQSQTKGLDPAVTGMDNSLYYHNCFIRFFQFTPPVLPFCRKGVKSTKSLKQLKMGRTEL